MLTDMKLSAMAAEFAAQLKDSSFNALSFEERFSMAVTAEWNKRQTNKVNRLIKKAHLGIILVRMNQYPHKPTIIL